MADLHGCRSGIMFEGNLVRIRTSGLSHDMERTEVDQRVLWVDFMAVG